MSLLMQALRKAERAKHGEQLSEPHPDDGVQLEPLETDIQKAVAGSEGHLAGGAAFSLEPMEPSTTAADHAAVGDTADIPVIPATEAMHDPVPPQARPGARRDPAATARASAEARLASDMPHGPRPPGGLGADAAPHASPHIGESSRPGTGSEPPAGAARPARTMHRPAAGATARMNSAAANRRLAVLAGILVLILLIFGFLYWRAVGGRPGASLPPVPMPAPGAVASTPSAPADSVIPGVDATRPAAVAGGPAESSPPLPPSDAPHTAAGPAIRTPPAAEAAIGAATASGAAIGHSRGPASAPATRPARNVIIPTPEALAAIPDPAIRAEAIRDAEERAARAARDANGPGHGAIGSDATAPAAPPRTAAMPAAAPAGAPIAADAGDVRIVRNHAPPQVSPALQNAWSAYNAGDLVAARQQYDTALLQDPNNRDALLGSAAVSIRERNGQQAAANYVRLLELDPNDPEALAGLVALRPGDIEQAESRLKNILQRAPESGPVLFTLGNLYARQGRWPEAQQSYFRAFSTAPTNPDYAFNLAVGLDRLNQGRLAQSYYQRALALAQTAPAGFDPNAVRKRLQELGASAP